MKKVILLAVFMVTWKTANVRFKGYDMNKTIDENQNACEVYSNVEGLKFEEEKKANEMIEFLGKNAQVFDIKKWEMMEDKKGWKKK